MATIFRAILNADPERLVQEGPAQFTNWLADKYPSLCLPELPIGETRGEAPSRPRSADGGKGHAPSPVTIFAQARLGEEAGLRVWRGTLIEEKGLERWTSTVTLIDEGGTGWIWVDVDQTRLDRFGAPPTPAAPGLLTTFADHFDCWRGPTPIKGSARSIGPALVSGLVSELSDPQREVAIVIVSPRDRYDQSLAWERGKKIAKRLCGLAAVRVLDLSAVEHFERMMPPSLYVYGGAVRTYLPGIDLEHPDHWRHRYVPFPQLQHATGTAAVIVARQLAHAAASAPVPTPWLSRGRHLPEFSRRAGRQDAEWIALLEKENDELSDQLERITKDRDQALSLADDRELEQAEIQERLDNIQRENDDLRRQVSWYRKQQPVLPPEEDLANPLPDLPSDACSEVLEAAARDLAGFLTVAPAAIDGARELDTYGRPTWARKARQAVLALARYAKARTIGELMDCPNFYIFCQKFDASATRWSEDNLALGESDTVQNDQSMWAQRHLPVDKRVHSSGRIHMPAHIKLDRSPPAPNIRFYDDTSGATGTVHIGYFGPHLDVRSTN